MGGMDKIVNKDVLGIVNVIFFVIIWLVNVKKVVMWIG